MRLNSAFQNLNKLFEDIMESIETFSQRLFSQGYQPIVSIEEGVEKIKEILKKDVLYKYDVDNINRIYKEIDLIEKKAPSSTCSSFTVTKKVLKKVQAVLNPQKIDKSLNENIHNLITLHHLQKFSGFTEEVLPVKRYYDELLHTIIKESEFDDLIASDSTKLLDHLIKMRTLDNRNKCEEEIKKMSFTDVIQVILQTKKAILSKSLAIPENCPDILLLIGNTKSGKTTTYFYFLEDEMQYNKSDFSYSSKKDREGLIGSDQTRSCTFFPNIQFNSQGHCIIDFAGFEDSNGPPIACGTEQAVISLILKSHPSVLVLESLANKENAYKAVAAQGQLLERLLGKKGKESCTLGYTKYSQNTSFQVIQQIKEKQKEQLETKRELEEDLKEFTKSKNEEMIRKKTERINKINEEEAKNSQLIAQHESEINKIEKAISNQIGISAENALKLDTLETKLSSEEMEILLSRKLTHNILEDYHLDPNHEKLIMELFDRDLKENKLKFSFNFKDFDGFIECVKKSSLISTLTEQTNPEIKELLHSPEMDPLLAINMDLKIVESTIKTFMHYFMTQIDVNSIQTFIQKAPDKAGKLEILWKKAATQVLQSLKVELKDKTSDQEVLKIWENVQNSIEKKVEKKGDEIRWGALFSWIVGLPTLGIAVAIKANSERIAFNQTRETSLEEEIQTCYKKLEGLYDTLIKLEDLKTHITSKKERCVNISQ